MCLEDIGCAFLGIIQKRLNLLVECFGLGTGENLALALLIAIDAQAGGGTAHAE